MGNQEPHQVQIANGVDDSDGSPSSSTPLATGAHVHVHHHNVMDANDNDNENEEREPPNNNSNKNQTKLLLLKNARGIHFDVGIEVGIDLDLDLDLDTDKDTDTETRAPVGDDCHHLFLPRASISHSSSSACSPFSCSSSDESAVSIADSHSYSHSFSHSHSHSLYHGYALPPQQQSLLLSTTSAESISLSHIRTMTMRRSVSASASASASDSPSPVLTPLTMSATASNSILTLGSDLAALEESEKMFSRKNSHDHDNHEHKRHSHSHIRISRRRSGNSNGRRGLRLRRQRLRRRSGKKTNVRRRRSSSSRHQRAYSSRHAKGGGERGALRADANANANAMNADTSTGANTNTNTSAREQAQQQQLQQQEKTEWQRNRVLQQMAQIAKQSPGWHKDQLVFVAPLQTYGQQGNTNGVASAASAAVTALALKEDDRDRDHDHDQVHENGNADNNRVVGVYVSRQLCNTAALFWIPNMVAVTEDTRKEMASSITSTVAIGSMEKHSVVDFEIGERLLQLTEWVINALQNEIIHPTKNDLDLHASLVNLGLQHRSLFAGLGADSSSVIAGALVALHEVLQTHFPYRYLLPQRHAIDQILQMAVRIMNDAAADALSTTTTTTSATNVHRNMNMNLNLFSESIRQQQQPAQTNATANATAGACPLDQAMKSLQSCLNSEFGTTYFYHYLAQTACDEIAEFLKLYAQFQKEYKDYTENENENENESAAAPAATMPAFDRVLAAANMLIDSCVEPNGEHAINLSHECRRTLLAKMKSLELVDRGDDEVDADQGVSRHRRRQQIVSADMFEHAYIEMFWLMQSNHWCPFVLLIDTLKADTRVLT